MAFVRLASASRNAAVDAVVDLIDVGGAGSIDIYTLPLPATPGDNATGTKLATLTFSVTAFGSSSLGTAAANPITQDSSADATGVAAWARIKSGAGSTIMDVDVGTSGATINLNTTSITEGAIVRITSGTLTLPSGV